MRRQLAAAGYHECVTYAFIEARHAALFDGDTEALGLENPISADMSHLRPDVLPGLLAAAARNQARGFNDLALFELGSVFSGGEPGEERQIATALLVGKDAPRNAHGSARGVDLFDARRDLTETLAVAGAPEGARVTRGAPSWFHPGRSGTIGLGPKVTLGVFGEIHPKVLAAMDVKGPAVAFTVELGAIPDRKKKTTGKPALAISDFQTVERDFAFVVDRSVEAAALASAAKGADKALIAEVSVFDVFEGESLGPDKKSVAISARLEPKDATLKDAEIEAVGAKIVAAVEKATGGSLRT